MTHVLPRAYHAAGVLPHYCTARVQYHLRDWFTCWTLNEWAADDMNAMPGRFVPPAGVILPLLDLPPAQTFPTVHGTPLASTAFCVLRFTPALATAGRCLVTGVFVLPPPHNLRTTSLLASSTRSWVAGRTVERDFHRWNITPPPVSLNNVFSHCRRPRAIHCRFTFS